MNRKVDLSGQFLIIDSFPVPVCQPIHYYGFKVHAIVSDDGYLGKELHWQLKQMGYELWAPYRKNMAGVKKHNDHYLMAIRRAI